MISQILQSTVLYVFLAVAAGIAIGYFGRLLLMRIIRGEAEKEKKRILREAEEEAERKKEQAELEAQREIIKRREEFEEELQETRQELRQTERRLDKREDRLDKREEELEEKESYVDTAEKNVKQKRKELNAKKEELEELEQEKREELERISGLSEEEAAQRVLDEVRREMDDECEEIIDEYVSRAQEEAQQKARRIVVDAIQRCSADSTSDNTVCSVELPNDEMKGRIIGRDGRNIRAFEKATGIDVIVDDTPGVVVLSGFDSVRREIARISMERLVEDGRIHPGRIEETVDEAEEEVDRIIAEAGKDTCYDLGMGSIPKPLQELVGRLKFRTSFGQNALQHSVEVAELAGMLASDVNMDPDVAKRAGILHDIGKALDHEHEGSHAELGADRAQRQGESERVVNAIAAHHEDCDPSSLYAGLIIAADTISASRPGARRETLDKYVKRLERLENLASQHSGVDSAYAIQAGREVRVLVDPDKMSDGRCEKLAHEVADEVEDQLQYPGEIQVTVIRESRYHDKAH